MSVFISEQELQPGSGVRSHAAERNRRPSRRVRQEVRDAMAVAAFSVGASTVLALSLTVLARVAG